MTNLWPLGIAIYVSGTIGEALGANFQRKSLTTEAARAEHDPSYVERGKFKQQLWVLGFFLFVLAGIFMSVALFFASQTVLAPLQLFLFVSNAFFAHLINQEVFLWLGLDGMFLGLVIVGVTMAIISAPKHSESYSDEEMVWLMRQPGFIAFCCFAGSFIIGMWCIRRRILVVCNRDPRNIHRRWLRTLLNMSYGSIAGAFGGVNVTLTKTLFSLVVGQYQNGGMLALISSPVIWLTSFVLVGTYVMQIVATVSGLEVTSAIIVISAHSVTEEVMATSGGILYFQDYLQFESWSWAMFIIGNTTAIFSVIGLSHLRLRDAEAKEAQARLLAAEADSDTDPDADNNDVLYTPSVASESDIECPRKRATSDGYLGFITHHHQNPQFKRSRTMASMGLHFEEDAELDTTVPLSRASTLTSFTNEEPVTA